MWYSLITMISWGQRKMQWALKGGGETEQGWQRIIHINGSALTLLSKVWRPMPWHRNMSVGITEKSLIPLPGAASFPPHNESLREGEQGADLLIWKLLCLGKLERKLINKSRRWRNPTWRLIGIQFWCKVLKKKLTNFSFHKEQGCDSNYSIKS